MSLDEDFCVLLRVLLINSRQKSSRGLSYRSGFLQNEMKDKFSISLSITLKHWGCQFVASLSHGLQIYAACLHDGGRGHNLFSNGGIGTAIARVCFQRGTNKGMDQGCPFRWRV